MTKAKPIAALAAALVAVILIFQNQQPVQIKLLFTTVTVPNSALIGIALLVGMAFGILIALMLSKKKEVPKRKTERANARDTGGSL